MNHTDLIDRLVAYWGSGSNEPREWLDYRFIQIAGGKHDQDIPAGINNPYWDVIRRMPCVQAPWQPAPTPFQYERNLGISRAELVRTYSWAIPTPGDIAWIGGLLDGRGMVEVGAGSGYWAWQLAQAGADVVAYEPNSPDDNKYVGVDEPYHPLLWGDETATAAHPDRALLMCWPSYAEPWAAKALSAYEGDLLFYVGEGEGGCCADDDFFALLDGEWTEIGSSPHHITWWAIRCRITAYRRGKPGGGR